MLIVVYAECRELALCAECHYAERHYAECHYAKCHFVECHYGECLGAAQLARIVITECDKKTKMTLNSFKLLKLKNDVKKY